MSDTAYDASTTCENCDKPKAWTPTETVEGRGPGWKCVCCRWWNWLAGDRGEA